MRRLSNGSNYLGAFIEEGENEFDIISEPATSRRNSSSSRRRTSFKGPNGDNKTSQQINAEQIRIAEMYKTVIKMSAENKINVKNSWSFDLIDQMGKLIRDEGHGINFQKASCTLDASVKIYSHRVDDTHASSHRILESLSRGGADDSDDQNVNADGKPNKTTAKVGSKHISSRLNIESTIEKNLENINMVSIEKFQSVDPTFYKMSKAFDEGGARGMLMNSLRVVAGTSTLQFSNSNMTENSKNELIPSLDTDSKCSFDLADLLRQTGISTEDFSTISICPALNEFRKTIGIPELDDYSIYGFVDLTINNEDMINIQPSCNSTETVSEYVKCNDDNDNNDYTGDEENDYGYHDNDENSGNDFTSTESNQLFNDNIAIYSPRSSMNRGSLVQNKIDWGSVFALPESNDNVVTSEPQNKEPDHFVRGYAPQQIDIVPMQNEYTFFDIGATLSKQNAWVGAKHWKFGGRLRSTTTTKQPLEDSVKDLTGDDGERSSNKKKQKKDNKSKSGGYIDFDSSLPSPDLFIIPTSKNGKSDPTQITPRAREKQDFAAISGLLELPADAKLQVKDLCRLFLCPFLIVPPTRSGYGKLLTSEIIEETKSAITSTNQTERVWGGAPIQKIGVYGLRGSIVNSVTTKNLDDTIQNNPYDDDDDDDGGHEDINYFNNDYDFTQNGGNSETNLQTGLVINTEKLAQANRIVGKVEIGYATVSTKVNVRKLKIDIWNHIQKLNQTVKSPSVGDGNEENISPQEFSIIPGVNKESEVSKPTNISFRDLMTCVNQEQEQKNVSLPFYFICLLHLANEKSLEIEDTESLNDLIIKQ